MGKNHGDEHSAIVAPGVRMVISEGRIGVLERIADLGTREALVRLTELITAPSPGGAAKLERIEDPSAFATACPQAEGGIHRRTPAGSTASPDGTRCVCPTASRSPTNPGSAPI